MMRRIWIVLMLAAFTVATAPTVIAAGGKDNSERAISVKKAEKKKKKKKKARKKALKKQARKVNSETR